MVKTLTDILQFFAWLTCIYYTTVNAIYTVLLIQSIWATREHHRQLRSMRPERNLRTPFTPPVSILVPARNEESSIVESVRSLLSVDYPEIEIIVVNDGSTDSTLAQLRDYFHLRASDIPYVEIIPTSPVTGVLVSSTDRRLTVLDKASCGRKADALNAGLNMAASPFVCAIDGDSVLERNALTSILAPARNDPSRVIASGGIVRAVNGCVMEGGQVKHVRMPKTLIEGFQVLEYLRSFLIGRQGWARFNMLLIISGAFGVFQRDACRAVGGFRTTAIGEDMDLIVRMHRYALESGWRYKIGFVADPVCWTEVPSTVRALSSQRARWQNGLTDVLWRNRDMTFNPAYGRIGLFAMPYQWVFECLAPLIEVFGWVTVAASAACGLLSHRFFLVLLVGGYLFSGTLSMGAVLIEEMVYRRYNRWSDLFRLIGYCFLEPLLYRPINTIWRLAGLRDFFQRRNSWQLLQRTGFSSRQSESCEGVAAAAKRRDRRAEPSGAAGPSDHARPSLTR